MKILLIGTISIAPIKLFCILFMKNVYIIMNQYFEIDTQYLFKQNITSKNYLNAKVSLKLYKYFQKKIENIFTWVLFKYLSYSYLN